MRIYPEIIRQVYTGRGLPDPVFEHRFHPVRKWRMDIAWPKEKIFIEVQGGIFIQGRHNQGAQMLKEWEKLNTAASMGWRVLFCQPIDVTSSEFIDILIQTFQGG